MAKFEEEYTSGIYLNNDEGVIDHYLSPADAAIGGPKYVSVRKLLGQYHETKSFFDAPAGTRVALQGEPADIFLSYGDNTPPSDAVGSIVTVKTANGNTTNHEGLLFVKWDTGEFGSYRPEHLSIFKDSPLPLYRKAYASIDLTDFMKSANSENELVHIATRDLWAFEMVNGKPFIKRLFEEDGTPLKC